MAVHPSDIRLRFARAVLDSHPLGQWYMSRRPIYKPYAVHDQTAVVVDGYPRSANTYAWFVLRASLGDPGLVSGHTHAASTLVEAARRQIPAMLIVRDPWDAVASYVQARPAISVLGAARAYVHFHHSLVAVAPRLLIVPFAEVTDDMGEVVRKLNQRYETNFPTYQKTAAAEREIQGRLDEASRGPGGVVNEDGVARPSAARRPASEVLAHLGRKEREMLGRGDAIRAQLLLASPDVR